MSEPRLVQVGTPLYGGAFATNDPAVTLPFVVPGETIAVHADGALVQVLERSAARVAPPCPHFSACGGCQYQMIAANAQGALKRTILTGLLQQAGVHAPPEIPLHSAEPYGYRNRIRLRLATVEGTLRFGYNLRGTTTFLPIVTCPISAPPLLPVAEALLALTFTDRDAAHWLRAAQELELFANDDLTRIEVTLFCAARTKAPQAALQRMQNALQAMMPSVAGLAAEAFDPRTGPTGRTLDAVGAAGVTYTVPVPQEAAETYWVSRGGFFQVNRFLLPKLVELVTAGRTGALAWDLFAGVGLFSRVLARSFAQVTAVEANPAAAADLGRSLLKLGKHHRAVEQTTLDFLRTAITQRERPDLIVLDPPRAGAGVDACKLLLRLGAPQIVYVSCDPTTLARDLRVLEDGGYRVASLDLIDLFPQTFHLESVAVLRRH